MIRLLRALSCWVLKTSKNWDKLFRCSSGLMLERLFPCIQSELLLIVFSLLSHPHTIYYCEESNCGSSVTSLQVLGDCCQASLKSCTFLLAAPAFFQLPLLTGQVLQVSAILAVLYWAISCQFVNVLLVLGNPKEVTVVIVEAKILIKLKILWAFSLSSHAVYRTAYLDVVEKVTVETVSESLQVRCGTNLRLRSMACFCSETKQSAVCVGFYVHMLVHSCRHKNSSICFMEGK